MKQECNQDVCDHFKKVHQQQFLKEKLLYYLNYERGWFDVVILGNHEFDYGKKQLDKLGKQISSTYINSNFCFNSNKSSIYEPYKIVAKKIGFIGVVTPLTFTKTYLVSIVDETGNSMYDFRGEELAQVV